jgi:hypothetical protein
LNNPGPGVQLVALASDGSTVYNGSFGNRGLEEGYDQPIDDQTVRPYQSNGISQHSLGVIRYSGMHLQPSC